MVSTTAANLPEDNSFFKALTFFRASNLETAPGDPRFSSALRYSHDFGTRARLDGNDIFIGHQQPSRRVINDQLPARMKPARAALGEEARNPSSALSL